MYFHIDSIASEISIDFFLLICSWVLIPERSIISRLMRRCKPPQIKNKDNWVKSELLLVTANSTIDTLSDQSSC